jgi:hypothetical protein
MIEIAETEAVRFLRDQLPAVVRTKANGYFDMQPGEYRPGDYSRSYEVRHEFIALYGFSILDRDTVELLATYSPLLEVGAGTGYWASELRQAGADVVATDLDPSPANKYQFTKFWEVERLDGVAAVEKYPDRTLLTVWPDYEGEWIEDVLKAYRSDRVLYVGEGDGGCTGTDAFHEYLFEHFERVQTVPLYQFSGIHDRLEIYERKKGN